jgi:hypothetical protein
MMDDPVNVDTAKELTLIVEPVRVHIPIEPSIKEEVTMDDSCNELTKVLFVCKVVTP